MMGVPNGSNTDTGRKFGAFFSFQSRWFTLSGCWLNNALASRRLAVLFTMNGFWGWSSRTRSLNHQIAGPKRCC